MQTFSSYSVKRSRHELCFSTRGQQHTFRWMKKTPCFLRGKTRIVLISYSWTYTWRQRAPSTSPRTPCVHVWLPGTSHACRAATRRTSQVDQRGQRFTGREILGLPSNWDQAGWSCRYERDACVVLQLSSVLGSPWLRVYFYILFFLYFSFSFYILGESEQSMPAWISHPAVGESLFSALCTFCFSMQSRAHYKRL